MLRLRNRGNMGSVMGRSLTALERAALLIVIETSYPSTATQRYVRLELIQELEKQLRANGVPVDNSLAWMKEFRKRERKERLERIATLKAEQRAKELTK
jgi:hypothetical protein